MKRLRWIVLLALLALSGCPWNIAPRRSGVYILETPAPTGQEEKSCQPSRPS